MEAVGTGGRLASDMFIEQCKRNRICARYVLRTIYLGCISLSSRPAPVLVKVHAQLACIAGCASAGAPPGRPDSDLLHLNRSLSQDKRVFFFWPLRRENQGDCAAPRLSPDASKRAPLHITHACLMQLRYACRIITGGQHPAAGDALFRQLVGRVTSKDGCSSPSRPLETRACDMSDMASARLDLA